ncbi:Wadjet anti-phage system protein JetD domain-containing protein [Agromyces sp. NPDC058110]|uniref:Wadjet anti-phage system protein JetD domain-containing protein n=1 Tax=Agromyces sp. NPDC058110 TaxID=3346345 RepID=UPI0036DBEA0C
MSPRLVWPDDAASKLRANLTDTWASRLCAELTHSAEEPKEISLRPGVTRSHDVAGLGHGAWNDWRQAWNRVELNHSGADVELRTVTVAGVPQEAPFRVRVRSLQAATQVLERLGGAPFNVDIDRARNIGRRLIAAGATLTANALTRTVRLDDADIEVVISAITWLAEHPDLGEWTTRQLPIPEMHTKWLDAHRALLRDLLGRDISGETRPRLAVAHLTYVDPDYLATEQRRHDAWTTGDTHQPAYAPQTVLIVENRDCRLWFPDAPGTIVVEGSGKAASSLLADVAWIRAAVRVYYWGDMDADGYAILDHLRAAFATSGIRLESILMDSTALTRFAHLGVNRDKHGSALKPSSIRLGNLTAAENDAYAAIATTGNVAFRRIEQERISITEALHELAVAG